MSESGSLDWYVLKTKPRAERLVADGLAGHAFVTYLPLIPHSQSPWRRSRRCAGGADPLFPGYVFAQLDLASPEWIRARSYPGVSYILNQDGCPVPLPAAIVETIRERTDQSWSRAKAGSSPFQRGERVRIVEGPLAGLEAIFDRRLSGRERCQVLLTLVHRLVPAALPFAALEKAVPLPGSDRSVADVGHVSW
ncbi:MAG: hypothetical protein HY331_17095 [Chloroflexi bacterium]|nr:hypothetical protein [Chloroflexota bacterium]